MEFDREPRANVGTGPFAYGCPSCARISLDVGFTDEIYQIYEGELESFNCRTLHSLQCLRMVATNGLCEKLWPCELDGPPVPSTLSRLEAEPDWPSHWQLDLLAVLMAAAGYIRRGVQLRELVCSACTTLLKRCREEEGVHPDDASGNDCDSDGGACWAGACASPAKRQIEVHYQPVLASLDGLTTLDLSSSHTSDRVLEAIAGPVQAVICHGGQLQHQ